MASRTEGDALRLDLARALTLLDRPLSFVEEGAAQAGTHTLDPARALRDIGDVVLARKGEVVAAYFMASAVDDAFQNVTHVVRGEDLFDFTPIQVILLALLELPQPIYHHHGLIRDAAGKRLAKRDDAKAISRFRAEGVTPAELRAMVGL